MHQICPNIYLAHIIKHTQSPGEANSHSGKRRSGVKFLGSVGKQLQTTACNVTQEVRCRLYSEK